MIIIYEEASKNPNNEIDKLLDDFVDKLEKEDVDIKRVSYHNKTVYVTNKEDYEYVTAFLDHDYKKEKQLGVRVAIDLEPGVNFDVPDPVIANEDIDKTDDTEEILLENEPDYPEEQIKDALQILGYTVKGYEYDGRLITKYGKSNTVYFDDWTDAQDFILNMYENDKTDEEYRWAYDVLVGNKTFDDYQESDYELTKESIIDEDDNELYSYIKSKEVYDYDGFTTEYTMYQDNFDPDHYVFVFGDSDFYNPNYDDFTDFDYECNSRKEADEWFNNYNGFEDELDD